jgi:hypothetical protein
VGFQPLEFLVGIDVRIAVVETNDHADVDEIWLHVVEEGASVGVGVDWPAYGVLNVSRPKQFVSLIDLPDLLESDTVNLGVTFIPQFEFIDNFLG